jgi:hypothetical protein
MGVWSFQPIVMFDSPCCGHALVHFASLLVM